MIKKDKIEEAIEYYNENKLIFEKMVEKIKNIIEDVIDEEKIYCNNVSGRVKELDSFVEKASKEKYSQPIKELTDIVGFRIITYVDSDVKKICNIIENEFKIDELNSKNKSDELGTNKVGYKSVHYIAELSDSRVSLRENNKFKGMKFEIQIRTILQHAWAEIEHDRNYKFNGVLPESVKRKFSLLSGLLEIADMSFDEIAASLDNYIEQVNECTDAGELNIEITTISLREYLTSRFKETIGNLLIPSFGPKDDGATEIIEELVCFGVKTLKDIELIIPNEYKIKSETNFIGLLRDFMLFNNCEKYFAKSWKHNWRGIDLESVEEFESLGVNIKGILKDYEINIHY